MEPVRISCDELTTKIWIAERQGATNSKKAPRVAAEGLPGRPCQGMAERQTGGPFNVPPKPYGCNPRRVGRRGSQMFHSQMVFAESPICSFVVVENRAQRHRLGSPRQRKATLKAPELDRDAICGGSCRYRHLRRCHRHFHGGPSGRLHDSKPPELRMERRTELRGCLPTSGLALDWLTFQCELTMRLQ